MAQFKNTFLKGRMNKDIDERLLPKGEYRDAENINIAKSEGANVGAIENSLGNEQVTSFDLGDNAVGNGIYADEFSDKIYWFVVSDSGSFLLEWDEVNQIETIVLADTRPSGSNILNLSADFYITGIVLVIDTDNNDRFLGWTDNLNPPRFINIERAKLYGENGFGQDEISLIKKPPVNAPVLTLSNTPSEEENNIREKFLSFAYRYIYLDGERSAYSPFTEYAFNGESFRFDFSSGVNESMVNLFNSIDIQFNTGSDLVSRVEVLFKESGNPSCYSIETFDKQAEGWLDNQDVTINFTNNKIYKQIAETQLSRYYDNVPLKAKAMDIIYNRIIFGNYTENYNLIDVDDNPVHADLSLELVTTPISTGTPTRTLKSNRDYEIGIAYLDEYGRTTTVLTSMNNTLYISNPNCVTQNQIRTYVSHVAPSFASYYRFFIKQTKVDYDVIIPTLFYQDGLYVWIKLEGGDVNKIKEGDFLYVKADTAEVLNPIQQTKVLEIVTQNRNFLEGDPDSVTTTNQLAGTYFKIKPDGFRMNEDDFDFFEFKGYDNSSNQYDNPIRNETDYIEEAIYYGTIGLDDMTVVNPLAGGVYTGTYDIRYIVEIDSLGVPDTFRWSDDNGGSFTSLVPITGAAQLLNNGVQIQFAATTGHDLTDNWIVSAKAQSPDDFGQDENSKAYAFYPAFPDDTIEGGARISIVYNEYNEATQYVERSYIATQRYANIEEWFYGDGIDVDLDAEGIPDNRVWFRRGTVGKTGNANYIDIDIATPDPMVMIIRSLGTQNNDADRRVKVSSTITIFQSESNIIFETIPEENIPNVFYEIGRTYSLSSEGYHLGFDGGDTDQTAVSPAEILLPVFNAIAWGNGFESYKIKDNFVAKSMKLDTRSLLEIDDYRQNVRIASLTYSNVFDQTTNYNALNEFNLSQINYKDLDDAKGSIQKLYAKDTNLIVFQENKVSNIPFQKDILYNADGTGNVRQSTEVLGTQVAYTGEYGISANPESFAFFGNNIWFADPKRGSVNRLNIDGITRISNYGMRSYFRDFFRENPFLRILGAYDPYHDQYAISLMPGVQFAPTFSCGGFFTRNDVSGMFGYIFLLNNLGGNVVIQYNVTSGFVDIEAVFNGNSYDALNVTGVGELSFVRDTLTTSIVNVYVTPVSPTASYTITNVCPIGLGDYSDADYSPTDYFTNTT